MRKWKRRLLTYFLWTLGIFLALGTCLDSPPPRACEMAQRAACRNRLRSVYQALQKYGVEHCRLYPSSLRELAPLYAWTDELECVISKRQFAYLGAERPPASDSILAYDGSEKHKKDYGPRVRPCVIVLLNNGDVVEMSPEDFGKKVREQTSKKSAASAP